MARGTHSATITSPELTSMMQRVNSMLPPIPIPQMLTISTKSANHRLQAFKELGP